MMDSAFLSRRNSRTNLYGRGARPLDPDQWIALRIDPAYADVIVRRWEAFTGKKAERA